MKNGKGTFYYANGTIYTGDWHNDIRHGKGKITFLPGSHIEESYEGDWVSLSRLVTSLFR